MIRVQQDPFDPAVELAAIAARASAAGAIASFVGLVRPASSGDTVDQLELEQYGQFTRSAVEAITEDCRARFDLVDLTIVHRFGQHVPGEAIVFVAAAAAHRRAAFDAVDYVMDRLKTEAPFWKREHGPAGSRWIEPTDQDHAARQRWDDD